MVDMVAGTWSKREWVDAEWVDAERDDAEWDDAEWDDAEWDDAEWVDAEWDEKPGDDDSEVSSTLEAKAELKVTEGIGRNDNEETKALAVNIIVHECEWKMMG